MGYPQDYGPKRRGLMYSINEFNDQFRRQSTVREEDESRRLYESGTGDGPPMMSSREDGSSRFERPRCSYCGRALKRKSATCGEDYCVERHQRAMEEP